VSGQYADFMGQYPMYQVDGVVKCGWVEDGFRDYLELMHQWYDEGLIGSDFYIENNGHGIDTSKTTNGQVGLWCHDYFQIELLQSMMADPNAEIVAVADAVAYEGQTLHFGSSTSTLGGITWAITTDCWDPEIALRYIDYFFTEEGSQMCNYGVEGEGLTYDNNGDPMYSELVYNNPDGLSMRQTQVMYTLTIGPFVEVESRGDVAYNEVAIEARQIWDSNSDDLYVLPSGVSLNTEQAQEFTSLIGDITTYVSGKTIEFIIGSDSLDNWDTYVQTMRDFGIDRVTELYQEAYDAVVQ
jgi:putative aldouronate transport system substrate-binding protein